MLFPRMKLLLALVFCFGVKLDGVLQVESCNETDLVANTALQENIEDYAREWGVDLVDNEEDVTNENNFVHFCSLNNYKCIREIFSNNSDCKAASSLIPEPLFLGQNTIFFPNANMTGTYVELNVKGLSTATVCSFYFNKKTKNLVFAIYVPSLTLTSPNFYFKYRRPGQESIVKSDSIEVTYGELIFTTIIPMKPKLLLNRADFHTYIGDSSNKLFVGPKAYESTNADVKAGYSRIVETLPIIKREAFLFQSRLFMSVFIEYFICDFRLNNVNV